MAEGRKAAAQLPPMGFTEAAAKFNAYSRSRSFIGVAETPEPKLDITERHALVNLPTLMFVLVALKCKRLDRGDALKQHIELMETRYPLNCPPRWQIDPGI